MWEDSMEDTRSFKSVLKKQTEGKFMWVYHFKSCQNRVYQIILSLVLTFPVCADIVTDGTVGGAQTLPGPNFTIPENLGSRAGANLFHSFQRFNIFRGESATFTGSNSIANVISRVTGGQASTINGLLRSTVGQANFYFINPAGVMFGANAQIDVPASFHVSTANELRFPDGAVFSATNPAASSLSIDQPQSFGFLGDQTAKISVVGSELRLNPGKTLSLSGGELAIDSSNLLTEAGKIQLVAVGDPATTMPIKGDLSEPAQGNLSINNSLIDMSGDGAGTILIRAGQSEINSSGLFADNVGAMDAALEKGIDIRASSLEVASSLITTDTFGQDAANLSVTVDNRLSVVNGGRIRSSAFSEGNAGNVTVNARQLEIDGKGQDQLTGIFSFSSGSTGHAGNIDVTVNDQLSMVNGGTIASNTVSEGNAGNVTVNARQLEIDAQGQGLLTGIISATLPGSTGHAGNIDVTVVDQLSIVNGGTINSNTLSEGNAGNITVNARQLEIDGKGQDDLPTGIFSDNSPGSTGHAGNIDVAVVDQLSIVNGGRINSNTLSEGNAGNVTVNARQLEIDGKGQDLLTGIFSDTSSESTGHAGNVDIAVVDQLSIVNGGTISSSTLSEGNAGNVTVNARQLEIDGKGQDQLTGIYSASSESTGHAGKVDVTVVDQLSIVNKGIIGSVPLNIGNSGEVTVNAGQLEIDGKGFLTGIIGITLPGSSGIAGDVTVYVTEQLSIVNGGVISSSTFSTGKAGTVTVGSPNISIDGKGSQLFTGISSIADSNSFGQAGNIILNTQNLSVANGGTISIESFPSVDATTLANIKPTQININAENITLANSFITTESFGNVPAGSINLNVADTLSLNPSFISTAANNADGGTISIRAKVIDLQDSQITTSVSGQGDGGNISLDTDALVLDGGFIQANTSGINAQGGNIRINTKALVASNNNILTGGDTPLSFQPGLNVIQAAAPDGVSGNIDITTPQLDISGDLIDLDSALLNVDDLAQNPCATTSGKQSTLVSLGRGGLPESPEQAGSIIITPERLQRLLPRSDTINDPESGSLYPETTRHKQSTIEPNTWLTWPKSDC